MFLTMVFPTRPSVSVLVGLGWRCCVYKAAADPKRISLPGYAPPLLNSCYLHHARLKKGDENKGKCNLESMAEHK